MQTTCTVSRATLAAIAMAAVLAMSSREVRPQMASCLVAIDDGDVQGIDNGTSCAFLGIPFAAPPVGELRWRPPQPQQPWKPATLNAIVPPPTCAQFNLAQPIVGSEDCLKLNIWTPDPAPAAPAPVIVWIHTGAFHATSANFPAHNGRRLAEQTGAIVVAANYRLGPLGFLAHRALTSEDPAYHSSGNYGFLDQRAALRWVREHIAAFGGDPDKVTIAGQSAGAHSVSLHLVSPGSAGHFSRAIMHSGYASTWWRTIGNAEPVGDALATALGCTNPSQALACMRGKDRDQVLRALPALPGGQQRFSEIGAAPWGPVVDGVEIPDQPRTLYKTGKFARVPLIIGATRDEGWVFVDRSFPAGLSEAQYQTAVQTEFGAADAPAILARYPAADFSSPKHALARLTGDVEYVCEARRIARLVSRSGAPVYRYSFEREIDAIPDQVIHGLDTNFVFGNNVALPPPTPPYVLNAEDLALFGSISGYWTRFAAAGDPNLRRAHRKEDARDRNQAADDDGYEDGDRTSGIVRWPVFKRGDEERREQLLVLDVPVRQGVEARARECDFWEPFFLGSVIGSDTAVKGSQASDLCGASISADLKLDHDVTCTGDGLTVAADGIRIRLNGHSITGSGTGAGIAVSGRTNVRISGGTIRNFEAGVRVNTSTGVVIRGNQFLDNTDGIDLQAGSIGNAIEENLFRGNRSRGIMIRSAKENTVAENTFTANRVGILLFGAIDSRVSENSVSESILAGIRINVFATGNRIDENLVASNPAGIEFLITPTGSAIGNRLDENTIAMNACGLKGPTAGNRLEENRFDQNTADTCP